jgi:hypothetical protein
MFGYWNTQFGLLVNFISIFTSRNYTHYTSSSSQADLLCSFVVQVPFPLLLPLVPLLICSERLAFTPVPHPENWFEYRCIHLDTAWVKSQSHIATDGQSVSQSVSLGVGPHLGLMTRYLALFDSYVLVSFCGAPSLTRGWVWVTPVVLKITPRHGPQRKHVFSYSDCCSR